MNTPLLTRNTCANCGAPSVREFCDDKCATRLLDEVVRRISKRRDEKADYPEHEHGKAAGLDEALEIIAEARAKVKILHDDSGSPIFSKKHPEISP